MILLLCRLFEILQLIGTVVLFQLLIVICQCLFIGTVGVWCIELFVFQLIRQILDQMPLILGAIVIFLIICQADRSESQVDWNISRSS